MWLIIYAGIKLNHFTRGGGGVSHYISLLRRDVIAHPYSNPGADLTCLYWLIRPQVMRQKINYAAQTSKTKYHNDLPISTLVQGDIVHFNQIDQWLSTLSLELCALNKKITFESHDLYLWHRTDNWVYRWWQIGPSHNNIETYVTG